jgi:hypothetical protein
MRRVVSFLLGALVLWYGVGAGSAEEPPVREDRVADDCSPALILPIPQDLKRTLRGELSAKPQPDSLQTYCEVIRDTIALNWNPWDAPAMRTGEIARIVVSFTVGRSGDLGEVMSLESSTFDEVFADSATGAIRLSAPFPSFPPDFAKETMRMIIGFTSAERPVQLPRWGWDRLHRLP